MYQARRDAMVSALEEFLPKCHWNVPTVASTCGTASGLDAKDMLPRGHEPGRLRLGTAFYAGGRAGPPATVVLLPGIAEIRGAGSPAS